jgi:hypothetical protein
MKTYIIIFLVALTTSSFAQAVKSKNTEQLMDSLKGKWIVTEVTNNKKQVDPAGFIEFQNDGKFTTSGSYFGTGEGLYTTDETRSTLYVEFDGSKTEWEAAVRNRMLRMELIRKKKEPRVTLVMSQATAARN